MFKYLSCIGGITSRCSFTTIYGLALMAVLFSGVVQAQSDRHGVALGKACQGPVRICQSAEDCSDGNACTPDFCDEEIADTVSCNVVASYNDTFGDTITLHEAWDTLQTAGGVVLVPAGAGNLPIILATGNTTCVPAGALPCEIGPATQFLEAGEVTFHSTGYMPVEADAPLLQDNGFSITTDACDGLTDPNCVADFPLETPSVGSTTIVDGCLESGPPTFCPPDDSECTEDFECDPETGLCPPSGPPTFCPPDDSECTEDFECDPETGLCPPSGPPLICPPRDDGVICDLCDPETGECIAEMPVPDRCQDVMELCRTPGFWGRRGGDEKPNNPNSQNITQQVIDSAGYLDVCGHEIDNTDFEDMDSAIEGICQSPKGTLERQLFRQLTAAALNCVMSGGGNDCTGVSIGDHYAACNTLCETGSDSGQTVTTCIDGLDCFNNGGMWMGDACIQGYGLCHIIEGDVMTDTACWDGCTDCCAGGEYCVSQPSCHDRVLCNEDESLCFDPPGPASSSVKCKDARKSTVVQLPF